MEDGSEQDIIIPFFGELLYADNEWVYYTKYEEEKDSLFETCICRAPIMKNQEHGNLILEKEEIMCEEKKGIGRGAKKYVEVFFVMDDISLTLRRKSMNFVYMI